MKKQSLILTLALVVLTFFGCKPPKEFIDSIKATPNPAEYKGGKIEVVFEGNFPNKYFGKKMTMQVVPVLTTADGKVYKAEPVNYQGEKVKDNNDVIKYKVGGKYTQTAVWDYVEGMETGVITLEASGTYGKKEYTLDPIKVIEGVNITPLLVTVKAGTEDLKPAIAADKFQRIIEETTDAQIKFLVNQSAIRGSEKKTEAMVALTKAIKEAKAAENKEFKSIEISSYASPEGELDWNEKLSNRRGEASSKYINRELKKLKASVNIDSKFTAEDWDGFQKLVEASSIEDKAVIIRVLSMYTDPQQREQEIKNLAVAYKAIAEEILPELRRSKMTLTVNVIGKSDAEIDSLVKVDAKQLNVEELLYAATLVADNAAKAEIYTKATEIYPNDYRSFNNLGMALYAQGKCEEAARCFAKALEMAPNCPSVNYNNGLIALSKNDVAKAEEFFGKAGGVGKDLDYANGAIAILKGNYKKAAELFGAATTNNAALANILNKNNGAARKALENVATPNAVTAYLQAILAARTNNAADYEKYVAEAAKCEKLAERAKTDVEFVNVRK
jgi:Tfp pilus assembly protein PilF